MSSEIFAQIRELKQQGNFVAAWDCGYAAFQNEPNNTFLRTSLFWVCYAAIKAVQEPILARQNKAPNANDANVVNAWVSCIGCLNLPVPCEELDYRFFNLFRGCGEHYQTYIQMLLFHGPNLYQPSDLKPYQTEKGESPSLIVRLARQTSKAWLTHNKAWQLNIDNILCLLKYAFDHAEDRNKIWLQFDISKCLVSANRHQEARETALSVLRKKLSESWAWGALAETYVIENTDAAIICFCKGILEAHEPPFRIPMYFGLAKLFSDQNEFGLASASLSRLIEIYADNSWALKSEHEQLVQRSWFDASYIETIDFDSEINTLARKALQYATHKLEDVVGIVDSHHRSGKGFNVYVDLNKKVTVRMGVYTGKKLPEIGGWVCVKLAVDGDEFDALEVSNIAPQEHYRVQSIEGNLKLHPKGFGFVNDAFIAPHLLHGFTDDAMIRGVKIWDLDPKKGVPSWRVINVVKL